MTGDPLTDVAKAVIDFWNATAAITTAVPNGLHEGPLESPADERPYATLNVKQGPKQNDYGSQGDWLDYEEVTITVYGIGLKTVGDAVGVVKAQLETGTLTIANATFMRLECLPGWTNEPDAKKSGQNYRKATLRYCVWNYRTA